MLKYDVYTAMMLLRYEVLRCINVVMDRILDYLILSYLVCGRICSEV